MLQKIILIFILTILLSNCSFSKQNRNVSPYFNGVLTSSGEAINHARILLSLDSHDTDCSKAKGITRTNKQGEFQIKPATIETTYTPFINHTLDEWVICAEYNGNSYTLYSNSHYGTGPVVGSVTLHCDLTSNPRHDLCQSRQ